jgi:nicotinamide mononucleotide (NMN) deamidase PncC
MMSASFGSATRQIALKMTIRTMIATTAPIATATIGIAPPQGPKDDDVK